MNLPFCCILLFLSLTPISCSPHIVNICEATESGGGGWLCFSSLDGCVSKDASCYDCKLIVRVCMYICSYDEYMYICVEKYKYSVHFSVLLSWLSFLLPLSLQVQNHFSQQNSKTRSNGIGWYWNNFSFILITKKILLQIQSEFEDSYPSFSKYWGKYIYIYIYTFCCRERDIHSLNKFFFSYPGILTPF